MTSTLFKKIIATALAAASVMSLACFGASATSSPDCGATVETPSGSFYYENIDDAWNSVACENDLAIVTLHEDWIADSDGNFGSGSGFSEGAIALREHSAPVCLDLNGFDINRNLKEAREGGEVFNITLDSMLIIENSKTSRESSISGGNTKEHGGAFYILGSTVQISRVVIENNRAEKRGGAMFIGIANDSGLVLSSEIMIDNCILRSNQAKTGGAIYLNDSNKLRIFDSTITANIADNDAGIHTEVEFLSVSDIVLGGKVFIKDNICKNSGEGLMLDENLVKKVVIKYDSSRPLSDDSEIVILSKTDDKTLRITDDSDNNRIGCFEYENDDYTIIAKGSGNEQYLDIKKA